MFSGSSAYIGGSHGRPNPQQFGESFNQHASLQTQGSNSFPSQPTGFIQATPSVQNVIGPSPAAVPPQSQTQQQYTGFSAPQPTGFSQMAASFQTMGGSTKPKGRRVSKPTTKIPNIRISFITAKDQAQFETLFKSAVGSEQTLSGEKSRDVLLRSGLDGDSLSHIWYV
jgi:actin cytoskeleton-regulatory complex protein PAN1